MQVIEIPISVMEEVQKCLDCL